MFFELLRKEFLLRSSGKEEKGWIKILRLFLRVAFVAAFAVILGLLFKGIDGKVEAYSPYGTFDFLAAYLFLALLGVAVLLAVEGKKTLFAKDDSRISLPLPISASTQVLAKVTFLFFEELLYGYILSLPALVVYGMNRDSVSTYYVFVAFFPLLTTFFVTGLSLLLSLLFEYVGRLLKKSLIAQVVFASVLVLGLCYAYSYVLDLFWNSLSDASIGGLLPLGLLDFLHNARYFLLPGYPLLEACILVKNVSSSILIFAGASLLILVLGIGASSVCYFHFSKNPVSYGSSKHRIRPAKVTTQRKSLLKKEFLLLFVDEGNLFSYTALLIMCPFLTLSVLDVLNNVFSDNLSFYSTYFPDLRGGIALMVILLFAGVINASASTSVSREKKGILNFKSLPYPVKDQLFAKLFIPFATSEASLLITLVLLVSLGEVSAPVFFTSLFLGTLMFAFTDVFGLYGDMKSLSESKNVWMRGLNEALAILIPILVFLMFFVFGVLARVPSYAIYLIANSIVAAGLIPCSVLLWRSAPKAFYQMGEVPS